MDDLAHTISKIRDFVMSENGPTEVDADNEVVVADSLLDLADSSEDVAETEGIDVQKELGEIRDVVDLEKASKVEESAKVLYDLEDSSSTHYLKWIMWNGRSVPIVTQNENGPCPLIAIINVLLLRGSIQLPTVSDIVTAAEMMNHITDILTIKSPQNLQTESELNFEQNLHDAISILPRLQTGLDVNIKFTGVSDFEYTPECVIFDLLGIPLYHGWLVDPQSHETVSAISSYGYNQLVERIIVNKTSSNIALVTEALIAEQFLQRTATQLTYHGLCELNATMKPGELAVFFRNNHFSTIFKKQNELYQLVTDLGFLNEPRVVWESLCNIEGDGLFVDSVFIQAPMKSSETFIPNINADVVDQIDREFGIGCSVTWCLAEVQLLHIFGAFFGNITVFDNIIHWNIGCAKNKKSWNLLELFAAPEKLRDILKSEQFARKLQREENKQIIESQVTGSNSSKQASSLNSPVMEKKKSSCNIL